MRSSSKPEKLNAVEPTSQSREARINALELASGEDLDGDGDIGMDGQQNDQLADSESFETLVKTRRLRAACARAAAPLRSLTFLLTYYAVTCLIFGYAEGWPVVDSCYYATVVMSTVGYGDLVPTQPATQAATVLLAFIGIAVVFSQALWAIEALIVPLVSFMRSRLARCHPPAIVVVEGLDGHSTTVTIPTRAVTYYTEHLMPVLAIWLVLQFGFAGLLCASQPMSFGLAFYHAMITSTTVGLGDVAIETPAAKMIATAHILVTVGTLSTVFQEAARLAAARKQMIERLRQVLLKALEAVVCSQALEKRSPLPVHLLLSRGCLH